jgi:hypothetical protein
MNQPKNPVEKDLIERQIFGKCPNVLRSEMMKMGASFGFLSFTTITTIQTIITISTKMS